jgi:hypothetical protein
MWTEVIFHSTIWITVRADVITIARLMKKHTSVLWQNTLVFCKTLKCFQYVGPVC